MNYLYYSQADSSDDFSPSMDYQNTETVREFYYTHNIYRLNTLKACNVPEDVDDTTVSISNITTALANSPFNSITTQFHLNYYTHNNIHL